MTRRLTLRARLTLLTAVAVAVAVTSCAAVSWFLTRNQLYRQLDQTLVKTPAGRPDDIANAILNCGGGTAEPTRPNPLRYTVQLVRPDGTRCALPSSPQSLVVTRSDVQVATGERAEVFRNGVTTDGVPMRILTRRTRGVVTISIALPLREVRESLNNLALLLIPVSLLGVLGAASAGLLIARAGLRPVDEFTDVVEHIARTEDLDTFIPVDGKDEITRLGSSFNTMTRALAASRDRQRALIADAGHELRTPLTSLRTNIDLLLRSKAAGRDLPADAKHRLLVNVKAQLHELSSLVGDLLELARPAENERATEVVALHEVVGHAVERARLRGPGLRVDASVESWQVRGDAGQLERAVMNLLDNAVKFSPPGGVVDVRLRNGELTVRDHGPGIAPEDLPHVFDRFWRSPSARSLPGSGLGLSIVALVVRETGGRISLEPAGGGGTLARMRLPGTAGRRAPSA
ncbi:sensor histidine kinase [Actinomadura alba]|uniref:histidine kinase n=1 Tax=Actinomadura alba TaxID=406431 RepID=A0ABR7LT66_9ACTN|nr:HAMP domain-containing sensor histidine kinase [Actinomadura alba]MBC6468050.1 HAMP domain-containing histidine kinase [Actinomadura alba]